MLYSVVLSGERRFSLNLESQCNFQYRITKCLLVGYEPADLTVHPPPKKRLRVG